MVYCRSQLRDVAGVPVASSTRPYRVTLFPEMVNDSPYRWPRYRERGGDLAGRDRVVGATSLEAAQDSGGVGIDGPLVVAIWEAG